ncbi:DUF3221 domain-containing protein [Paenibacillus sp. FSL R7-0331]|uniref:DUF3221 domain-containing protein n=1 Tax=Paenibacillus sp. FSL R7-0331 TaxID=1536773 RepID=UPI0004F6AE2D|nr:DUF3221 domain-containing protein [Paenibacillus sp. FSL R7-0331]AIQ52623.1 hypothetical protein R70331_14600 [Paenibacillus sp. FSL R7-0331]
MFNWKFAGISLGLLSLLLTGCGAEEAVNDSGTSPAASHTPAPSQGAAELIAADPEKVQLILADENIINGDIFLENNQVHINIVGLNSEVEALFAGKFASGSYRLHDVGYSAGELEAAQNMLAKENLYKELNLYGSWIDVRLNKINVSVPDDYAEAARETLEQRIDPGMLTLEVQELGEPSVTGTIVEVRSEPVTSILILEPGKQDPTYWFSFNDRSELYDAAGQRSKASGLKQGQQVHIWGTGTVQDSMPAQGTVRRVELIE